MIKCPGQDNRFWKPEDISDAKCPGCGRLVEFFKDEPRVKCRKCGCMVANPKIELGCAQWCQYAAKCTGVSTNVNNKKVNSVRKFTRGFNPHVNSGYFTPRRRGFSNGVNRKGD